MNVFLTALALAPLAAPLHPSLAPAPAATPKPACVLVVVARHDTAQSIAQRYGVTTADLYLDSAQGPRPLNPAYLPLGEVVRVALPPLPLDGRRAPGIRQITLQPGDTLSRIEAHYNLSEQELISANLELQSLDKLSAGDILNIPTGVRGLLLTVKPGQNVADLIHSYHADPLWTARVNGFTLPTELRPGDQLLLPGIFAKSLHEELLSRRVRAVQQAHEARVLARYQAFLAWKAERQRQRQLQFERYQAWLKSPEHLAEVKRYERQAEYEAWQAHEARVQAEREAKEAQTQALAQQAEAAQQQAAQTQGSQEAAQMRAQMAQVESGDPRPQMQMAAVALRNAPDLHLSWPLERPRLTSRFGEEDIPFHEEYFHTGQDMAAPIGTPIHAAAGGTVTRSGDGAYGINVYVQQGANIFIYGHMSQTAVEIGQVVQQGDLLGYVGCTGECTGPHLHFEIRLGGIPVDPMAFLP